MKHDEKRWRSIDEAAQYIAAIRMTLQARPDESTLEAARRVSELLGTPPR
jgi:hypothetical protein